MCVGYNSLRQSLISPPSTCYPLPRQKSEAHTVCVFPVLNHSFSFNYNHGILMHVWLHPKFYWKPTNATYTLTTSKQNWYPAYVCIYFGHTYMCMHGSKFKICNKGECIYIIRQIMACPQLYNKVDRWLQGDGLPSPSNDKAQHYKQVHSNKTTHT